MAFSDLSHLAVVLTTFLLPIVTYLYFFRGSQKSSAGPLPPPTEITDIFIHPIKSCHYLTVKSAKLLPTGLDLDRHWMWVSYPELEFQTIRQNSNMTLIRPTYDVETDTLTVTAPAPKSNNKKLQFSIPAHPSQEWLSTNTELVNANIWGKGTPAHIFFADLTGSFNDFFGKEVRLVYKSPFFDPPRKLASNGAETLLGRPASTCFPDMMPILVSCESSIDELNSRIRANNEDITIDIHRFRPNIIVKGNKPWDEDRWKTLRILPNSGSKTATQEFVLDVTQRCARCQVPNVDPDTAEKHKRQPWDTLMKYRRIDEGITYKPCFGMLCVPRGEGGMLEVGMKMEVTEVTDKHRYIPGF
ncbi:hypothetical protein BU23DRAFT_526728 [Bimuria novae-zelandiae CBS 107.79]|uniref:MOSC domain-containing protein n=1 Tax=Bimuria novae-zelandiae CBS 107.79 TaxID=1447943 RepID=A0A6A5VJE3_9PLEO|nr:hypothetical protein BU23DRAFT_526728 [Bimuria novae-zelandiae CBS 107.79]